MTITIELTAEEERRLREQADRQGQAPEGVVRGLVHQGLTPVPPLGQTPIPDEAHEALVRRLLETGLMTGRPARPGQTVPFRPITVQGLPVSETIIEERR